MVFENFGPPLSNVMQIIHMPCIVQETQTYEIESIFLNHPVFRDTIRTAQETHSVSVIKASKLTLCREIIAVCSEIRTKHVRTLCGEYVEFINVKTAATFDTVKSYFKELHLLTKFR